VGEIPFVGAADRYDCQGSRKIARDVDSPAAIGGETAGCRFCSALPSDASLSNRLQSILSQLSRSKLVQGQPLRDVLFILGELNDSDIDWMIATGSRQKIAAHCTHPFGGPVDALYILLGGTMTVSISEDNHNLARAFAALAGNKGREVARLSRKSGETPSSMSACPLQLSRLLKTRLCCRFRQQLAAKLQQDVGFASRFIG